MPSSEIALWCEIACFDEQEEHPLFLYPYLTDSGNCQNTRNMQQTINFEAQAQTTRPAINVRATIQRKIKSLNLWLHQKQNKKNKANICNVQNFFLSLPCQKITSGTDTAESPRHFLYPHFSENNITAPCRVFGNDPGSSACKTLTTRSAVSLCQNLQVMATTINATRTAQRSFSLKEWMNGKSNFYTHICGFPVTRRLVLRVNTVSLCLILAAIAVEQRPLVAITSALCAGWLVYRINKTDKKGGNA